MTIRKASDRTSDNERAVDDTELGRIAIVKIASPEEGSFDPVGKVQSPFYVGILAQNSNGEMRLARLDATSRALMGIDIEHFHIHNGDAYYIRGWTDVVNETPVVDYLLITPDNTRTMHIAWKFSGEGEFTISIHEDVTVSANGNALSAYNINRNSAKTPLIQTFNAPTVTDPGTRIYDSVLGSGKQVTGDIDNLRGIILKKNSKYLFRCTKVGTGTLWFNYNFQWYEPVPEV